MSIQECIIVILENGFPVPSYRKLKVNYVDLRLIPKLHAKFCKQSIQKDVFLVYVVTTSPI